MNVKAIASGSNSTRRMGLALLGLLAGVSFLGAQDKPAGAERERFRERGPEVRELAEQLQQLQRQLETLRQELRETQGALRGDRPERKHGEAPTDVEQRLRFVTDHIRDIEHFIGKRLEAPDLKEARQKLQVLAKEREGLLQKMGQERRDPEHSRRDKHDADPTIKEFESQQHKLHEQLREVAQEFRRSEGSRRQELRKKFDELAAGVARLHQRSLQHHAELLEQQLKKVREEMERSKDRIPEMLEKMRREMLEKQP